MDLHRDFKDLLAEFVAAKIRFVVVGGYAVGHHAKPRATKDLELLVPGDDENLQKVARALASFGAPAGIAEAAGRMKEDEIVYLGTPPVRVDILRRIDGVDTEAVLTRCLHTNVDDLEIPIIAFDDLVTNKRAAGREHDLADVATLERFRPKGRPTADT